jgi:GNAT superfamily N-acetyltransferase
MKIREKESKDQPWIEKILDERWGGEGRVVAHGEIFDVRLLPALIGGEQEGLATYQIRRTNIAELITLDAVTAKQGVGTALIEALVSRLRVEGVSVLRNNDQRQSGRSSFLSASRLSNYGGSSRRGRRGASRKAIDL